MIWCAIMAFADSVQPPISVVCDHCKVTPSPSPAPSAPLPPPTAFWTFQEPTGSPRMSTGLHTYSLTDGDLAHPVERVSGGMYDAFVL